MLNNKQSESGIEGITKFNPLRAKADSFGFRRGYFLKSKKMELAEVKKHFENAEFVETATFLEKRKIDLNSICSDKDGDFWSQEKKTGYIFCLGSKKEGFAKILTEKEHSFSITKDQLRQLTDPKIKEWFPEVFSLPKDFTGWVRIEGILNKKWLTFFENGFQKYGFDSEGNWFSQIIKVSLQGNEFETTNEEVFEALKKEAVKRGFEKGTFVEKCLVHDISGKMDFEFKSRVEKLKIFWLGGFCIFKNGKWATIIQTITKSEAEKLLNKKIID